MTKVFISAWFVSCLDGRPWQAKMLLRWSFSESVLKIINCLTVFNRIMENIWKIESWIYRCNINAPVLFQHGEDFSRAYMEGRWILGTLGPGQTVLLRSVNQEELIFPSQLCTQLLCPHVPRAVPSRLLNLFFSVSLEQEGTPQLVQAWERALGRVDAVQGCYWN